MRMLQTLPGANNQPQADGATPPRASAKGR